MRLLLDTVTFIWSVASPERISATAMKEMQKRGTIREISVISLSEIAIKTSVGKLTFSYKDVTSGIADLKARVLPYTLEHCSRLFGLPLHHSDPFDRQIIAQALAENLPVVTADEKFNLYEGLKVIW
jgi:PIN domain nuclease of toxin-antitoxin system